MTIHCNPLMLCKEELTKPCETVLAMLRADPLNPRRCPTTFGAYGAQSSYVELPDAPPLVCDSLWRNEFPKKSERGDWKRLADWPQPQVLRIASEAARSQTATAFAPGSG